MKNSEKTMEKIVALCKGRGFVYSGSEIYGGLANTWDYGPLGVEFKNNVKAAWRKKFVQESQYNVGLDSAILMNPMTWVASGHVGGFSLWGIADRTNFDLTQHQNTSGVSMEYFDQEANEKYIPYVIEPSLGADRVALAFLCDAYDEEVVGQDKNGKDDVRTVLRLHPALAPFKAAVLPLSKKLTDKAMPIWQELAKQFSVDFDDAGSIGKRYRREDEIGTPYCVTVDFETEQDGCVTVRDRDTMEQERIKIEEVAAYIAKKIEF